MRNAYTLVDFTDEEHDLALAEINLFGKELFYSEAAQMTFPVIALSSRQVTWGEHGLDTTGKFALVLDVKDLTKGAVPRISPLELGYALFDDDVRRKVTHAMINAMAWIKDVEVRGLNIYNEREVLGFFHIIQETFLHNVAKHLARKYGL